MPLLTALLACALALASCGRAPADFDSSVAEAEALIGLGRAGPAASRYRSIERAFRDDPRWAGVMLRIAEIESNMLGDRAAADRALSEVVRRAPLTEAGRIARETRAGVREASGDYQGAIEDYTALMKHFPEGGRDMLYRVGLAGVYLTAKDFRQSRIEIKPLVEGKDVPPEVKEKAIFLAAESFFLDGQVRKAAGYYEWLMREFPESPLVPEAKLHLATCIEEMGHLGVARDVTKGALDDYPNKGVVEARLKSIDERGTRPAKQVRKELAADSPRGEGPKGEPKKVYKEGELN
ncbi:MAG: tetratricopeptide repeat protein [Proteobacteria bacterium]|nr:tetratricopeptide repeat protein [Pseudomonadota bacterium]